MGRVDIFDQPVTLTDADALAEWNAMCLSFLAHAAATPSHLAKLLDMAPDYAAGHAIKGLFHALLGQRAAMAEAAAALARAKARPEGNGRERALVRALGFMTRRAPSMAVAALEEALSQAPGDTLLMKLSHAIRFVTGDVAGMRRSVERVLPAYPEDHPGRGYLLGCHAFSLEETGEYDAAIRTGHAALALAPNDAWGLHAVAHVHDMRGDAQGGLDWLDGREDGWAHCNNFRFHIWWHKALMLLDLGRLDAALAMYDARIRAERTDDYRDISNATSLLCRLEMEGTDVGSRWEELADLCEARTGDGCLIFADLHYLLALTGDDRVEATSHLLTRLARDAEAASDEVDGRMASPGLPAAEGLRSFAQGRYASAFGQLLRARPSMQSAGGSHAQRDVFERITIEAGIRAGRFAEAGRVLADRTSRRGGFEDGYAASRRALLAQGGRAVPPTAASA